MLANRLSGDPNNTVLLVEAGDNDGWIWSYVPVGFLLHCIGNTGTNRC